MSENRKENTLTTPNDRDPDSKFRPEQEVSPLNNEETVLAMQALNNNAFVKRFPEVERRFVDPSIDLQRIGLISFVPSKGATPNEDGIYGFAKLRGNFATPEEADERAEYLIRNVDSYHQIYHTYVGRPFPITVSSDYSKEVNQVDLRKEINSAISEDVKRKRDKEQREIEEIKAREQELLEDVKKEKEDLDDYYTTLRVKKAQLTWTYAETKKKINDMVTLIAKTRHEIHVINQEHPELKDKYYNKYMNARRQAGLSVDKETSEQSFMKYLVEDLVLPEVDEEYNLLYNETI